MLRKDNKTAAITSATGAAFGKPKFSIIAPINYIK